jgi:TolB-like protein
LIDAFRRGERHLKDYISYNERPRPKLRWSPGCHVTIVMACLIVLFSGILLFVRQRLSILLSPPPRQVALAVLPFDTFSGERSQDQISDRMTDELIARFGSLAPDRLRVIPRTAILQYKGKSLPADQIGLELGADYILTGTVRQYGPQVHVSARLLRVTDQTSLWTETYDRELIAMAAVQSDLVGAVAGRINIATGYGN